MPVFLLQLWMQECTQNIQVIVPKIATLLAHASILRSLRSKAEQTAMCVSAHASQNTDFVFPPTPANAPSRFCSLLVICAESSFRTLGFHQPYFSDAHDASTAWNDFFWILGSDHVSFANSGTTLYGSFIEFEGSCICSRERGDIGVIVCWEETLPSICAASGERRVGIGQCRPPHLCLHAKQTTRPLAVS